MVKASLEFDIKKQKSQLLKNAKRKLKLQHVRMEYGENIVASLNIHRVVFDARILLRTILENNQEFDMKKHLSQLLKHAKAKLNNEHVLMECGAIILAHIHNHRVVFDARILQRIMVENKQENDMKNQL
jgi:aconitase A